MDKVVTTLSGTLDEMPPLDVGDIPDFMGGGPGAVSLVSAAAPAGGGAAAPANMANMPGAGAAEGGAAPQLTPEEQKKALLAALTPRGGAMAPLAGPGGGQGSKVMQQMVQVLEEIRDDEGVEEVLTQLMNTLVGNQKVQNRFSEQSISNTGRQQTQTMVQGTDRALSSSAKVTKDSLDAVKTANDRLSTNVTTSLGGVTTSITGLSTSLTQERQRQQQQQNRDAQATQQANQAAQQSAQSSQQVADQGTRRGSLYVHDYEVSNLLERILDQAMGVGGPVGGRAVMDREPLQVARARDMVDLHAQMQQRFASDQPPAGQAAPLAEMSEATRLLGQQLAVEQEQRDLLQEVADYLRPTTPPVTGTGGIPGSTRSRVIPSTPPRYFRATTGQVAQSSSMGVIPANI